MTSNPQAQVPPSQPIEFTSPRLDLISQRISNMCSSYPSRDCDAIRAMLFYAANHNKVTNSRDKAYLVAATGGNERWSNWQNLQDDIAFAVPRILHRDSPETIFRAIKAVDTFCRNEYFKKSN